MTNLVTQTEFAAIIGNEKSYVSQLKKESRLVMKNGKIMVEESRALIKKTADPSKHGVVERHAKEREQEQKETEQDQDDKSFNHWKTKNEKQKFIDTERESKVRNKELLEINKVKEVTLDTNTIVRNRLESMSSILAPQLAIEQDENKIRSILIDQIEFILSELQQTFLILAENNA